MKSRIVVIFAVVCGLWVTLALRGVVLQVVPNSRLDQLQHRQFARTVKLQSRRGAILDRDGKELAISVPAYSLFADPLILEEPARVAQRLARALKLNPSALLKRLSRKESRFVWLARLLPRESYEKIKGWKIRGLGFIEESRRVYPNNQLLAQVLGVVGRQGEGLEGLELAMESELKGSERQVIMQRDARGRPLVVDGSVFFQHPDGSDIHLTIDSKIQFTLEQELRSALKQHSAQGATGIILDAQTSEILAMASVPTYDANLPHQHYGLWRNRAITDNFEPGSTMKPILVAGALRAGLLRPNSKIDCEGGKLKVGGRLIREAESDHKFGQLTVSEILTYSSNVGSTKIAFMLGADEYSQVLRDFGFGEKTGVQLPGEGRGLMSPLPWRPHLLSNISFGHGIGVTALQVANAYTALANGGWLKRPLLVKRVTNIETGEEKQFTAQPVRQVLSAQQAATLTLMLSTVTQPGGTGRLARVPGFPVAGKTGTAQRVAENGRGYEAGAYIASFAGYLPAHQPKFVIYVAVDGPQGVYYGSQVAAPIFARLGHYLMRQTAAPPVLISQNHVLPAPEPERTSRPSIPAMPSPGTLTRVPDLTGLTLREVLRRVSGQEIDLRLVGKGKHATRVWPPSGDLLGESRKLVVEFAPDDP